MGKTLDDNMAKQQAFMVENQKTMMERNMQMQNYMREMQMAMQIARARDLFHFWAVFYSIALPMSAAGFRRTRNPAALVPIIPLTFVVGYFGDMAYGTKMKRIVDDADVILKAEQNLLKMPRPLPSVALLDERRSQGTDTPSESPQ